MNTYILKNDEQTGPYDDETILAGLQSGAFSYTDYAWREGMAEWQFLSVMYPQPAPAPVLPIMPTAAPVGRNQQPTLTCRTCGYGELVKRKKFRLSTPVVVIGYLFLIPSIVGMLIGCMLLFGSGLVGTAGGAAAEQQTRTELVAKGIPGPIINKVVAFESLTADETSALTPDQMSAVEEAKSSLAGSKLGAGAGALIGGTVSIALIISSFVGGLIGWLLVMKKKVLQCTQCSAVVAAS